jgi:ATP-binding cassette subfamily B protein
MRISFRQYLQLLSRYLHSQWPAMAGLALLLIGGIVLSLINPQIIRYFIDTAQSGGELVYLLYAAGAFIVASLISQVLTASAAYLGQHIGWSATNRLREELAEHCLSLDMSFHKSQTPGSLIERVDGDVNVLGNFFSNLAILLVSNVLLIVGILAMLYREGWQIGVGMTAFALFALWAVRYVRKYAIPHWERLRRISAEFYGFVGEQLEGTEDTRANGATDYVMHRFFDIIRRWLPIRVRAFMGWALMWITTIFVFALGNAAAFSICAWLWSEGRMTVGAVYLVFAYTEQMVRPIEQIRTQLEDLQRADASIKRVRELLDTKPAITDGPGAAFPKGPLAVEFDAVRFSYEPDSGSVTLDGVEFRLAPGRVLGLLGRTGSGKTTIARLLLRFYDPQEGSVRIGGIDIRQAKLHELRGRVGMVTQNIEIFHGTIRDNLTLFDETIPDDRVMEVLAELGLDDWLRTLPAGLDTVLDSGGGGLSAGEAQLLAFARVFLRDPGVIILDEASSRLDPATEARMERAITQLLGGRTCIIIAHRLRTIERADEILILEGGRVIEHGERLKLAADPHSRFNRLLQAGMEEALA